MKEKNSIKKLLSDKTLKRLAVNTSMKQLERQIRKGDVESIEELVNFLLEVQGKKAADNIDTDAKADKIFDMSKERKKYTIPVFHLPRRFVAAATAGVMLFTTNTIVKAVTEKDIFTLAVDISKSGFSIDLSETIELPTSEDDPYGIKGECQKYGYTPDVPFYLPEGFELKHMDSSYIESEKCNYNSFTFKKGKGSIFFSYDYFANKIGSRTIPSDDFNLNEIEVNGTKAILSQEDGQYVVNYQKDKIIYVIFIQHVDYSECDKIIESIK